MIFIDAVEIDERLASHLVGPDSFLRDQLISLRFSELSIAAPILKLDEPALFVVVVVSHGSKRCSMISTIRGSGPAAPVGICARAHPAYKKAKSDGRERCPTSSNRIELEVRMPRD